MTSYRSCAEALFLTDAYRRQGVAARDVVRAVINDVRRLDVDETPEVDEHGRVWAAHLDPAAVGAQRLSAAVYAFINASAALGRMQKRLSEVTEALADSTAQRHRWLEHATADHADARVFAVTRQVDDAYAAERRARSERTARDAIDRRLAESRKRQEILEERRRMGSAAPLESALTDWTPRVDTTAAAIAQSRFNLFQGLQEEDVTLFVKVWDDSAGDFKTEEAAGELLLEELCNHADALARKVEKLAAPQHLLMPGERKRATLIAAAKA